MNEVRGIQAVQEALRLETYPLDRAGIYYAVGDIMVFDAKGAEVPVRDILDRSPRSEFWSADEVIDELARCFPHEVPVRARRKLAIEPALALGWFSIALGVTELLAPRLLARASGLRRGSLLMQAFGVREIATGIGLLTQKDKTPWLWARTAGDVLDLATIATGNGPVVNKSVAAAIVGLVGVVDATAAIQSQRGREVQ